MEPSSISIWWLLQFIILPLGWIIGQKLMKTRDDAIKDMKDKIKQQDEELKSTHDRVIKLEASSVSKSELIEILRNLEEAIEQRFDKSFEKLEKSFERLVDRQDK